MSARHHRLVRPAIQRDCWRHSPGSIVRPLLKGIGLAAFVAVVGVVAAVFAGEIEEGLGLAWLFEVRGAVAPPDDVAIVAIDQQSARALGLPAAPREWPRALHARAVRALHAAGARLIVFDLRFDTAGRDAAQDETLARAFHEARNVVLVESLRRESLALRDAGGKTVGTAVVDRALPPIDVLRREAAATAPFPLPKSSRVDAFWTFMSNGRDSPTLPGVALHLHTRDTRERLFALWQRAAPPAPAELAPAAEAPLDPTEAVLSIRSRLLADTSIAPRIRQLAAVAAVPEPATATHQRVSALLDFYGGDEARFLNFYGPPRTIETVPYHVLIADSEAASPRQRFAGKTVFVGFSAGAPSDQDSVRDDYHTVFTSADGLYLSGVEIAATAFANLVEGKPLRTLSPMLQLGIGAVWGLLMGYASRRLRPPHAVPFVLVSVALYGIVALAAFKYAALWIPTVTPMGVLPAVALFAGVLLNHRDARRERETIKRAFGYFLPNAVVDRLADQMGPVGATGQLVHGTCLATDAEHYTSLAERMDPATLAAYMNRYYAQLFEPVARRGGIVSDVVGDSMVAIWASASSDATLRRDACIAALEMARAIDAFNRTSAEPLRTRIGLHSGQMLLGNVGAAHHYEYRAVGDIVNTASRIQALNKQLGTCVLVSETAVDGLPEVLARPLGSFVLPGKSVPVRILELVGVAREATASEHETWARFATALEAWRAGNLHEAARDFTHVLEAAPDDGPARFYLLRCRRHAERAASEPWVDVVHIDDK